MERIPIVYVGLAVILAVASIAFAVHFMFRITKGMDYQGILVSLVFFCMIVLTCVYAVDKIISVRTDLLTEAEGGLIFDLIKLILVSVTSYIFGAKSQKP